MALTWIGEQKERMSERALSKIGAKYDDDDDDDDWYNLLKISVKWAN